MPAVSTPDSASEEAAQRPGGAPSEAAESLLTLSAAAADGHGVAGAAALGELADVGIATPMDPLAPDDGGFRPLADDVMNIGGLADVAGVASFLFGVHDSVQRMDGLRTMFDELAGLFTGGGLYRADAYVYNSTGEIIAAGATAKTR